MKIINIEQKSLTNGMTDDVIGIAVKLKMTIQYMLGDQIAKGYFEMINNEDTVLRRGNKDIDTTGWIDDDSVMFKRFVLMMGAVEKL